MIGSAIIVGGGIGGLAAGIALRQAGWRVRVLERAASPRELGFALLMAPNAMAALGELGVADAVAAQGYVPVRGEVRRLDGTVLKRAEFPPPELLGGPTVVTLRSALHGTLVDALGLDHLRLSGDVVGCTEHGGAVRVELADGETIDGDLLIGADGIGSTIRRLLHPGDTPPRRCGIMAVRGAVHGTTAFLDGLSGVYYLGPGVESFLVRASETGVYWALSLADTLVPSGVRDPRAILDFMAPKMDVMFRQVTAGTEELRFDDLVDRDPIPEWGRGAVTLLGDAAHPVLPHTGQGAAQAIVDAVALARQLSAAADTPTALRAYERERQPKTASLVAQGRRTARLMRTTSASVCAGREVFVRLLPVVPLVKLFARINRRAGTDVRRA